MMKNRSAGVLERKGKYFFVPYNETVCGVEVVTKPITDVPEDAEEHLVGRALLATLAVGQSGIDHPADWSKIPNLLQQAVGVRSNSALMRGARYVSISDLGEVVRLIPSRNGGPRKGFQFLPEEEVTVPSSEKPEELGAAVRRALELCT